jgi:hypothetical protein
LTDRHPSSVPLLVFAYLTLFSAPFSVTPELGAGRPGAGAVPADRYERRHLRPARPSYAARPS